MFDDAKNVIAAAIGLIAIIPGGSILLGLQDLPIDFQKFAGYTLAITGPASVLILLAIKRHVLALPKVVTIFGGIASLLCGVLIGTATYDIINRQIGYYNSKSGTETIKVYFVKPESLSQELDGIVNGKFRGHWKYALTDDEKRDRVTELLKEESIPIQRKILLYLNLGQFFIVLGFLSLAWLAAKSFRRSEN